MLEGSSPVVGLDHVQVTTPRSREAEVKAFYTELLGLEEVAKPAALVARGGAWFRCGEEGALHLGVEDDATFHPQRKAHPALLVRDGDTLAAIQQRLARVGAILLQDVQIPGYERFETRDPAGNRIEIMCHITAEDERARQVGAETDAEAEQVKARVRETFGRAAEAYVASPGHAAGDDLQRLLDLAAPQPTDYALDVSTGGGHVALALAPHVAGVIASDLTPRMLDAARTFLATRGMTNATFVVADAERLPFLDASFDLVTVRIAPHHYADVRAAAREMARVLRPGGRLIVIDNIAPEDARLDALVNDWEKRRDPSHVRAYTATEWQTFVAEAGLRTTHLETGRKSHAFTPWVERVRMPDGERVALEHGMLAAEDARAYFEIREEAGRVVSWTTDYLILRAEKGGQEHA